MELIKIEQRINDILEEKEVEWRLKSKAIWMECGDENIKIFQAYTKGRKISNTFWSLKDIKGREVSNFEGLSNLGKNYFHILFLIP